MDTKSKMTPEELGGSFLDAYNRNDLDAAMACLAESFLPGVEPRLRCVTFRHRAEDPRSCGSQGPGPHLPPPKANKNGSRFVNRTGMVPPSKS